MLYDRDYMREPEKHLVKASIALLWVLGACFIVQGILLVYARFDLAEHFGLSREGIAHGRVWQFLTYQFLHAAPWPFHVLGNCIALYFFGRTVEETLGTRRFLAMYFTGGVAGGLLQLGLVMLLRPHESAGMVGASAGVMALIAAFCRLYPEREACFVIYFFPITLRAKMFLKIVAGFAVLGAILPWNNVAHAAHLGGLGVGYLTVEMLDPDGAWIRWRNSRAAGRRKPAARKIREPRPAPEPSLASIGDDVDAILDKIGKDGIHSLTEAERRTLEAARKKIGGR